MCLNLVKVCLWLVVLQFVLLWKFVLCSILACFVRSHFWVLAFGFQEFNFTLLCWLLSWNSYTHYWFCDIGMMVRYCRLIMWGIIDHPYAFHGNLQRLLSFLWDANCVEMWNYACSSWRIVMGWIVVLDLRCQLCCDVKLCMQ